MNKSFSFFIPYILPLFFLSACISHSKNDPNQIMSMQTIDRNGFSETISNKERLSLYKSVNFLANQPYQKVLRVFGRDKQGKTHCKITSYHSNGHPWQYLEVVDGRAHGAYQEWHENGKRKVEAQVIEGTADINEIAQSTWLFEGKNLIWDEEEHLIAEIFYDKGMLEGTAQYYHSNGQLYKTVPYEHNLIEGDVLVYNAEGLLCESMKFKKGLKEGRAFGLWKEDSFQYEEEYQEGLILNGQYYSESNEKIAEIHLGQGIQANFENNFLHSLIEFKNGKPEGTIKIFSPDGFLLSSYQIKNEKKNGFEWQYYLNKTSSNPKPKLLISWHENLIQGVIKTWYENGALESEREMSSNKKHGYSFAYYKTGDLMLAEEYENDKLISGSYFKKGEKKPISKIESGSGLATLFDADGFFLNKVSYEKGVPLVD